MLLIQDKIVDRDILQQSFACQLDACKGACCWEGDFGAPLEDDEITTLDDDQDQIKAFLTDEGNQRIEAVGTHVYYEEDKMMGTPLLDNGACAFMTKNDDGIACCGIELAHSKGATKLKKPISCHLYPIRVEKDHLTNFEHLRYDRWDICSAACTNGQAQAIRVFEFAKDALVRKYGLEWYDELVAAYDNLIKIEAE